MLRCQRIGQAFGVTREPRAEGSIGRDCLEMPYLSFGHAISPGSGKLGKIGVCAVFDRLVIALNFPWICSKIRSTEPTVRSSNLLERAEAE